jgi:hypothetical protein
MTPAEKKVADLHAQWTREAEEPRAERLGIEAIDQAEAALTLLRAVPGMSDAALVRDFGSQAGRWRRTALDCAARVELQSGEAKTIWPSDMQRAAETRSDRYPIVEDRPRWALIAREWPEALRAAEAAILAAVRRVDAAHDAHDSTE